MIKYVFYPYKYLNFVFNYSTKFHQVFIRTT